jgi:signal transduction histidine kinase
VLLNLLNNAFKHTAKDSRIDLRLEREGERARFTVSDDGYGIPETLRERIFDKYVQVEGAKDGRKYGTGLGLYFCRMAMEGMGGTIGVNSEVGRGASFFIELPLKTGE